MNKIKKNKLTYLLILFLFVALSLFITQNINIVFAEDSVVLNETTATIKVTTNGETTYYNDFSDVANNSLNNLTIVLLKNTSLCTLTNKIYSIDLNGKNLSSSGCKFQYSTITILDSIGTGKITGSISLYSSSLTVKSAGEIEQIIITSGSSGTILGGKIKKINAIKTLNMSGGEIDNLCIYEINLIHLSGGTINNFTFVNIPEDFNMLENNYIYASKVDNSPIKTSEMTPSTQVNIINCPHPTLTNSVCDYCEYVCNHSGNYNTNGVCDVCGYVCPHLETNENNVCSQCNNQIMVNLKNSSTNKNYISLKDALTSIKDNDTLTLYSDIALKDSLDINTACTIDLNGYKITNMYVSLNNKITVIDSKGNGSIAVSSTSSSSQIELKGDQSTNFMVMLNKDRLKFYFGKIQLVNIYDGIIENILPDGYIFVKHDKTGTQKLTKKETNIASFYVKDCYLTCQVCEHDSVGEDLNCEYCGTTLTQEQILQALKKELETTKEEFFQAIMKKEDITSINNKVKALNDTIANTETICKTYSDEKDEELKQELQSLINTAKQEAISSSGTALELAKTNLINSINEKLDIDDYNLKVEQLTTAIHHAEISSNAYTDSKNLALKNELLTKINESKDTLKNVNDEMLERLSKAENKIDNNTKDIKSLKIALIILSILFFITLSLGFTLLYLYINKKCRKNSFRN